MLQLLHQRTDPEKLPVGPPSPPQGNGTTVSIAGTHREHVLMEDGPGPELDARIH